MKLRPRLTYANVAATIALVLAIGGGTVYAASQLGKNDVKSKNIAPGAVKTSDLGKNAVTSPKIKNGGVNGADIAAGVIRNASADVTGSATGGVGVPIPPSSSPVNIGLGGTSTFTPQPGEVAAIAAEAQFDVASTNTTNACRPSVGLLVNGQPTRVFLAPDPAGPPFSSTIQTLNGYDADGPFGLVSPGTTFTVTALLQGDSGNNCTTSSKLDKVVVRIVQIH